MGFSLVFFIFNPSDFLRAGFLKFVTLFVVRDSFQRRFDG
ncbi:hypothetical protein LEP1GSC188_1696 [Leptospira weilii serovar Topaz str. LT2116]|uniref:Uncharacterized protein n=1 Tax=Leptospira weilii serovar Topaz str. LT2116 TaxID=1088540 RepID=M3G8M2_9LEPT|nr:hypothetical protein LEP1GSC188_1696 [Leptospira weilii serovar Topaz str. LT2116]